MNTSGFLNAMTVGGTLFLASYFSLFHASTQSEYVQVQAQVENIEIRCFFHKSEFYVVAQTTLKTDDFGCDTTKSRIANQPENASYDIWHSTYVNFSYVAPEHGGIFSGRLKTRRHHNGDKIKIGDQMRLYVHKKQPETYKRGW